MRTEYDVITVGTRRLGIRQGARPNPECRFLVAEREQDFSDCIRGEWIAPWGCRRPNESKCKARSSKAVVTKYFVSMSLAWEFPAI
jgi:hypothetical protein